MIHGLKMTNSIDHSVKNVIQMGPNFISSELVKNIACINQKMNNNWTKEGPHVSYSNC
jgi:hypothetical protein